MLAQTIFDQWGTDIKNFFANLDPIYAWAWVLIVCGIVALFMLILFTEFKRTERESIKFSFFALLIAAACLGFGLHLLLTYLGLW
jgi:hypothetical protein